MDELLATIRAFDGVLEVAPAEGSSAPPVAWGDHFFYDAPDGRVPEREQPWATIVTKDYPGDALSDLDHPGRWRLNVHVGAVAFAELLGEDPGSDSTHWDYAASDVLLPHPVYRAQGWVAVITPGPRTRELVERLLRQAHEDARRRTQRRAAHDPHEGRPDR